MRRIATVRRSCLRRLSIAAGGTRQGLMVWRSALRADCTAVLSLASRRRTRFDRCAHYAQTTATSQITRRAARADSRLALLVATNRPCRVPPAARARLGCSRRKPPCVAQGRTRAGRGAPVRAPRSARPMASARSAHRELTRRRCLSAANAVNAKRVGDGATSLSIAGQSAQPTVEPKRHGLPGPGLAAPTASRTAVVRIVSYAPLADCAAAWRGSRANAASHQNGASTPRVVPDLCSRGAQSAAATP